MKKGIIISVVVFAVLFASLFALTLNKSKADREQAFREEAMIAEAMDKFTDSYWKFDNSTTAKDFATYSYLHLGEDGKAEYFKYNFNGSITKEYTADPDYSTWQTFIYQDTPCVKIVSYSGEYQSDDFIFVSGADEKNEGTFYHGDVLPDDINYPSDYAYVVTQITKEEHDSGIADAKAAFGKVEATTKKPSGSSSSKFTNKFGTPTTKCAVAGCSNYIASSGDTNCCTKHSNKCLNCKKYIDGDAMYCMSCLRSALE